VQQFQNATESAMLDQEVAHHAAHCFDYIRQSIICNADTSLEGRTEAGPGWGSKHECKDYDAILAWANDHTVYKWKKNMPDETVL
jgi:Mycotoxin biosynthesis protein UstYa